MMCLDGDLKRLARDFILYGEMRKTSSTSQQLVVHLLDDIETLTRERDEALAKAAEQKARAELWRTRALSAEALLAGV